MIFALDTNTVIDFLKGRGRVGERLLSRSPAEIALPAIVPCHCPYGSMSQGFSHQARGRWQASSG